MRPASFGIVFAMLFLSLITVSDYRTRALQEITMQTVMYNNCLDSAIEDAMTEVVEVDEGRKIQLNKEKTVDDFFTALAVNFGAMENSQKRNLLKAYVPAVAFVERNRLTLYYGFLEEEKKKEVYYELEKEDYRIYFTLTDYVLVENKKSGETLEGDFHDVGKIFKQPLLLDADWFHEEQKKVIREVFIENMEAILEEHNEIAEKLGIHYHFFLPVIENEEWYRSVDEISMLVFFQGYPYGSRSMGYYNRTAIGGAEIKKEREIR